MEADVFWDLIEGACRMGRFVAAVPNVAASANIVGKLEPGSDGDERVLQKKKRPNSHIHFKTEQISEFVFIYLDPGTGPQPCLEVRTAEGQPVLRLYYQGKKAVKRYDEFMTRHAQHEAFISGSWAYAEEDGSVEQEESRREAAAPAVATASPSETIFVSDYHSTDAGDVPVI